MANVGSHQETGEYREAIADMYKAIEVDPQHKTAPKFLAVILVKLSRK